MSEQARVPAGSPEGGEFGSGGGSSSKVDLHRSATREEWANRPGRESLTKKMGKVAFQIKARDGHKCVYCNKAEAPPPQHQLDHLVPRVQGGKDEAPNLVTACKSCNAARHEMSVKEWSVYAKAKIGVRFNPSKVWAQAAKPLPVLHQTLAELKRSSREGFAQWAAS
jgi:HNH endonuclease